MRVCMCAKRKGFTQLSQEALRAFAPPHSPWCARKRQADRLLLGAPPRRESSRLLWQFLRAKHQAEKHSKAKSQAGPGGAGKGSPGGRATLCTYATQLVDRPSDPPTLSVSSHPSTPAIPIHRDRHGHTTYFHTGQRADSRMHKAPGTRTRERLLNRPAAEGRPCFERV